MDKWMDKWTNKIFFPFYRALSLSGPVKVNNKNKIEMNLFRHDYYCDQNAHSNQTTNGFTTVKEIQRQKITKPTNPSKWERVLCPPFRPRRRFRRRKFAKPAPSRDSDSQPNFGSTKTRKLTEAGNRGTSPACSMNSRLDSFRFVFYQLASKEQESSQKGTLAGQMDSSRFFVY